MSLQFFKFGMRVLTEKRNLIHRKSVISMNYENLKVLSVFGALNVLTF